MSNPCPILSNGRKRRHARAWPIGEDARALLARVGWRSLSHVAVLNDKNAATTKPSESFARLCE